MAHHALTPRNIEIRDRFDSIAPRYDLTNRVISLGVDLHWRRTAIRNLEGVPPDGLVLDLACGTCDMAKEVLRQRPTSTVVGADLSLGMLSLARRKLGPEGRTSTGRGTIDPVSLVNAPAEALPFRDGVFDAVTIAFGIRNVPEFREGLEEILRVLKPGGRVCILEFSTPPSRWLWRAYSFYFFNILPRIGGLITGRHAAYRYLTDSVSQFPDARTFRTAMEETGFIDVAYRCMNGGIVCVHTGTRP